MKKQKEKAEKAKQDIMNMIKLPVLYTAIAILVARSTTSGLTQIGTFFALLLVIVIKKDDSRIPIGFALLLLMLSAFQLAFMTEKMAANNTAILAYYLLGVGVLAQFIEYLRNPRDFEESEEENKPSS